MKNAPKHYMILCLFAVTLMILFSTATVFAASCSFLNDGLVACWPFNGNANDESGNGHHGAVSGATLIADQLGTPDKAYSFNGIDDFISIGADVKPLFPLTVTAWIKINSLTDCTIFTNDLFNSSGQGYYGVLVNTASGTLGGTYGDGGYAAGYSRRNKGTNDVVITVGNWHHVAVKFTAHLNMDLYVDGLKRDSQWGDGTGDTMQYSSNYGGAIGSRTPGSPPYWFDGSISEVRVYNRALSDTEIYALATNCEDSPNECSFILTKTGSGTGSVTTDPSGINCGASCTSQSATFSYGTEITLTAAPESGYALTYWSGGCNGTLSACSMVITGDTTVTAAFVPDTTKQKKLQILRKQKNGGDGLVRTDDLTINCGATCSKKYFKDSFVTLNAVPDEESSFVGWRVLSGLQAINPPPCPTNNPSCTINLKKSLVVKAIFGGDAVLTVLNGSRYGGTGTVTSNIPGINCGTDCQEAYPYKTFVRLTANPTGNTKVTWVDCPRPSGLTCSVTLTEATTVKAIFKGQD